MKRPSRSKKRYKKDDDRPYFKRGEQVEVTQDFIENIGDPDFPPYGWIVKKSRPLMSDPGYEYLIERDPEFAADDGYDKSYWVYDNEIRRGRYNEGTFWPTPENERIPIYTIELIRVDDDGSHDETPMQYQTFYYSDDEAFAAAENLADKFANEDGKFEVHVMAGEYVIDDSTDIYGDKYVDGSIQTGRGWKMVKEGFMTNIGKDGQRLYSIVYSADGWDGSVQEYGKTEEDAIQNAIAKGKIDYEDEIVKIVDLGEKGEYLESSRKLVKEGAGAGYDVGISDLEIGEVTEVKELEDGDYSFTATIKPGNYEISASDYYNDFFWQEHEFGDTPEAQIDGGVIHGTISTWEDTDNPEEWVRYQVEGTRFNLSFMYGGGWMHVNLPEDGQLYIDKHIEITPEQNFSIDDIQLDAIDLVQAVNAGYASLDDRDSDEGGEEDEGELMNESLDEDWHTVTMAFDEFNQKLWNYSKQKHDERLAAFRDCSKKCEKALRDYYNAVVYDGED